MATFNGRQFTPVSGLDLKASNGCLRFETPTTAPTTTSGERLLYANSSNQLIFDSGSTTTVLGSSGSVVSFTLDDAYDDGSTITVDAGSVTLSANIANPAMQITQSGAGADITGTSSTWSVSKAGALTCISIADSGTDTTLQVDGNGTGGVTLCGTSTGAITLTTATTATVSVTITGSEASTVLTVSAGDVVVSDGSLAITDDDNAAGFALISNTATTADVATITANGLTTGSGLLVTSSGTITSAGEGLINVVGTGITSGDGLKIDLTELTLDGGNYLNCYDDTNTETVFKIAENGAITITGSAVGTNAITITAGDITVTDGNVAITSTATTDVFSITDNSLLANNALIVKGSGTFTGTGASAFVAITPTGASTGTGLYVALAAATTLSYAVDVTTSTTTGSAMRLTTSGIQTGVGSALEIVADAATTAGALAGEGVVKVSADGLTTGVALNVESASNELMTSGQLADFTHSAVGTTVAAKTGALFSITSSITESGTSTQDFDVLSLTRTSIHDTAGTLTATGAILKLENVATETAATLTDTVNGLEILMDTQGTGDGVKVTHSATGAQAINVISAATTVSCVLITGSGVKANNKASLEVTNSGATAAGGSILRATNNGTPAAATSYLVDFDYSGATMTNNPTTIFVDAGASTNSAFEINTSGASAASKGMVSLLNSNTGATGVVLHAQHTSTGSAANSDDVFILKMEGLDSGDAVTEYCRITAEIQVVTAGQEDGRLRFDAAADNGTLTLMAQLNPRAGGALAELVLGSGAGNTYLTTSGAYDLIVDTNQGTNSGSLTIADGVDGDVTLAVNGTGNFIAQNLTYETNSGSAVTGTTTLVWGDAEGQIVFCTSVGGAYSITLPSAATAGAGGWYTFIKTDAAANLITIDGSGAETIGEAGSALATTYGVIDAIHDTVTMVCDGTSWYVTAQNVS